jgi:hypothetical protein
MNTIDENDENDENDDWDTHDFEPQIKTSLPISLDTLQITTTTPTTINTQEHSQEHTQVTLTIDEVEVKYPSGKIPRHDPRTGTSGCLPQYLRNREIDAELKRNPELDYKDLVKQSGIGGGLVTPEKPVQGSSKIILKTTLINKIVSTLDILVKDIDFIKFSQNWSRPIFQSEILNNITKKDNFKFRDYAFNIKKTLQELNDNNQYCLTKRKSIDIISIITPKKTKIEDLFYTLYKIIIYIIYNSMRLSMENAARPINKYDIFEMLCLLKILRLQDTITIQYIQTNY